MMKNWIKIVAIAVLFITLSGCQSCTRSYGGYVTINIPAGEKVENAVWVGNSIDYMTRPRRADEKPETHILRESSNLGIAQSTVTIIEH